MENSNPQDRHDLETATLERLRNERQAEIASLNVNTQERCTQFAQRCNQLQNSLHRNIKSPNETGKTGESSNNTDQSGSSSGSGNGGSSEEEENPHAILVEIRALVEQRPVSSILNTALYRRQLEEIIRVGGARALATAARTSAAAISPATPRSTPPSSSSRIPSPRPRNTTASASATNSPSLLATSQSQQQQHQANAVAPTVNSSPGREQPTVSMMHRDIVAYHREQIQQELDGLLQRGLVSQVLHSDFSETLSHLILTLPGHEMVATGGGLPHVNSDDSVSIISASAQAVPHSHTTAGLVRQVGDLRNEVNELKSMIRLLMDSQLETQRCIRQEVAPFLGQAPASSATNDSMGRFNAVSHRGNCLICMNRAADMLVYRCGHLCMCHECSLQLQHYQHRPCCPVCRGRITDIVRVFAEEGDPAVQQSGDNQ